MDQINTKSAVDVRSHSFVGTEEYMAPEIVTGKEHDSTVDWWSLGILLYELLVSYSPFRGTCQKETFRNIIHSAPDLSVIDSIPAKSLIKKLLTKVNCHLFNRDVFIESEEKTRR